MATFNLFSKRQKKLRGEVPEVYGYEIIPKPLRVQIVQIIQDSIGETQGLYGQPDRPSDAYKFVHEKICHEYGVFTLGKGEYGETHKSCVLSFILSEPIVEKVLDVVELIFRYLNLYIDKNLDQYKYDTTVEMSPKDATDEQNERFQEHGVGYQYASDEIIRVDSTIMHSEIVKPVLKLLHNKKFSGANDEYLKAHEHYRHGRNKECLTDCLKAFESTMKIICKEKGWTYNETDTSKKLINVCFQNNLVPAFTQNQFTSLQNLLESGIPAIRNKLGGHGQGSVPQKVNDEMTRYALNLTGANIIFLIEQSEI
jgi:hypothetical protein